MCKNDIYMDNYVRIYKYNSSLKSVYLQGIDNMYFNKKVRFLLAYLCGGGIYYISDINTGDIMGYCMVSKGKSFHYRYAESCSITLGPIYLKKQYRGKGLSKILVCAVLDYYKTKGYKVAYAGVHKVNKQSNALFQRLGFKAVNKLRVSKFLRQESVTSACDAAYTLYRFDISER